MINDITKRALHAGSMIALVTVSVAPRIAIAQRAPEDLSTQSTYGKALRDEGLHRSKAMSYATDLSDSIGARLSGSPNIRLAYRWSMDRLRQIGAVNVHLEDAGTFGLSWRLDNVWMSMTAPDAQPFVVQAAPWSVGSKGTVHGDAVAVDVSTQADFARYAGKLGGKIVLLGAMRPVPQPVTPFSSRLSDQDIADGSAMSAVRRFFATRQAHYRGKESEVAFKRQVARFLASEGVSAVVLPSPDAANGGGTGDLQTDNYDLAPGRPWVPGEQAAFPIFIASIENYGRAWRLLAKGARVELEYNLKVAVERVDEHLYNVVGDLPGSDPSVAGQYVIVGGHLDSWGAGTGATDDGAGVAASLEALRLLCVVKVPLRRTVRVVLYSGEEQGDYGSAAYVATHLGTIPRSTDSDQMMLSAENSRKPIGKFRALPGYNYLSIAYDVDVGSGKIRGLPTGGNHALAAIFRSWSGSFSDFGLHVLDETYWPADNWSFSQIGIPGILLLQDPLDYFSRTHHTNLDTVERLVPEDLATNSIILAILLAKSANAPFMMPRTRPDDAQ